MLKGYLVGGLLLASLSSLLGADTRPNLVFLMSDDQSTYTMGCYGNKDVQTPHLDRLAHEGMIFDRHYDTTAICMASRATVMTGMYEFKTGCNFEHGDMILDTWKKSYPVLLRAAGYKTAFAGKFGFSVMTEPNGKKIKNTDQDFDQWAGAHGQSSYQTAANEGLQAYVDQYPHSTLAYGAFGSDFIREASTGDEPFCLSISFKAPHQPATPDPRFDDVYKDQVFKKPANFGREHGEHFSEQSKADRQYERFYAWKYADQYDQVMAKYNQQVYAIDQAVGMIREALKEAGVDQNTVIIYTSDNGFLCGSHGYGSKVLPYEESSRVPMIILDPREANSGRQLRSSALTGNCDFAPTLLTLAGVPVPANMDGRDLMALYRNPTAKIHDALPLINVWGATPTHSLSVVDGDYKYIYWFYTDIDRNMHPVEELYHLTKDPLELENLAGNPESQPVLQRMRKAYDAQVKHWVEESVNYNGYQQYGTLFDRHVAWEAKAALIPAKDVKAAKTTKTTKKNKKSKETL